MSVRAIPLLAGFAALGLLPLAGCSGGTAGGHTGGTDARSNAVIVALQSDGKTLDPHMANDAASMRLSENIYSTLMRYTADYGAVEPGLAESYTVSDDGLTYTFTLRTNAHFHASGRVVTAEDARYSIERIRDEGVRAYQFEHVTAIDTPDARTVVFQLAEPLAPFLTYLAYPMNAVVDREAVDAHEGSLDHADGGSGPFRLVEWKKDQRLVLAKVGDYYLAGRPFLHSVTYRPIPDETARTTALRNGEIDILLDVAAKDIDVLKGSPGVVVKSVPGTFWEYIGLNTGAAPFDKKEARQAVAWAVDREVIAKLVKFGRATILDGGWIPPNHWAYADLHLYPRRDVEKARQLMSDAGYPDGCDVTLVVGSEFAYQVRAAEIVKQQLKDIGIRITIRAMESGVFFDKLGHHDFQMTIVGWLGFVDPDEWTYNLFHTDARWNQQQYSNARVDELLEEGRRTRGQEERKGIYREIQRLVAGDCPMVFLYVNDRTAAYLDRVTDFVVHPTVTTISLRDTKVAL